MRVPHSRVGDRVPAHPHLFFLNCEGLIELDPKVLSTPVLPEVNVRQGERELVPAYWSSIRAALVARTDSISRAGGSPGLTGTFCIYQPERPTAWNEGLKAVHEI
jgi:hypothetical protein